MCFHHADGFFNITVFVGIKDCLMFVINLCLDALIEGIESEKIGALGLDVIDGEEGITHVDHRVDIISNQKMAYLRQFRNVVMTQHMAFYTEEAVASMARCGIEGIQDMAEHERGQWEVVFK